MATARIPFSSQGAEQYRELAKRMRDAGSEGKRLRSELRQRISDAGKPVLEDVRAAVRELEVTSSRGGGTGQRRRHNIARAAARGARPNRRLAAGRRRSSIEATKRAVETEHRRRKAAAAVRARGGKAVQRAERRGAGLRDTVARATKLQITNSGVRFVTQSDALPDSQRSLPRHLDSEKGWRHPVFRNRDVWVLQRGGPWFADTIKRRSVSFRQACLDAIDAIEAKLEEWDH